MERESKKPFPYYVDDVQFVDTKDIMAKFERQQKALQLQEAVERLEANCACFEVIRMNVETTIATIWKRHPQMDWVTDKEGVVNAGFADALIKLSEGLGGK